MSESNGDRSPTNGKEARWGATLPFYRSILALDIEGSTQRTNPIKEELRELVYRLVRGALSMAGIDTQDCDPFTDRGDGILILLRATDEFPKPFLLSRLIPALASLLSAHNNGVSPAEADAHHAPAGGRARRGGALTTAKGSSARTWTSRSGCWTHRGSRTT